MNEPSDSALGPAKNSDNNNFDDDLSSSNSNARFFSIYSQEGPAADRPGIGQSSAFAETIAALQQKLHRYDTARAGRRLSDALVRGAVAGLALRGGLHLVSYIVGILVKTKRKTGQERPGFVELLKDTLRWGAFLGSFSGVFVSADETIAFLLGRRRTAAWRALVSGAIAGPTLLLTGPHTTHTSLALYVFLRGLTLLVRCGNLPTAAPWKRHLLAPTRWKHGDVFLMCLSTCQFGYSWILMPSTLPMSYVRFLNKHGGKELWVLDAIREMCGRTALGLPGASAVPLAGLHGTAHEHFCGNVPCEFLHPGQSCSAHTLGFIPEGYLRAIPVYLPVYVIPAALVHRRRLLQPGVRKELWTKVALGALRSSLFLTLYCALAWRGACAGWTIAGRTSAPAIVMSCWIAGLATLVEKKSRRMELALYCLSRSVEAFSLTLVAHGYINTKFVPKRLDVLLFSAATAAICHCYSDHWGARRDVFKSKYLAGFDFILGNSGFEAAGVSHDPSNVELFAMAGQKIEANALAIVRSVRSMTNLAGLNGRRSTEPESVSLSEGEESSEDPGDEEESVERKEEKKGEGSSDDDEGEPWPSARSTFTVTGGEGQETAEEDRK